MMLYTIYAAIALATSGVLLTLLSEGFAYEVSRVVEAAFDGIEYRLAKRTQNRAEYNTEAVRAHVSYPARLEASL